MAWQILLSSGAPPKHVTLIRDLHTHHSAVIRSQVDSAPVGTSVGSKQGYVLAHLCPMSVLSQSCASYKHSCSGLATPLLQDYGQLHELQESHKGGADVDSAVC